MTAKEPEHEAPTAHLQHQQVPAPSYTVLGGLSIDHTLSFCIRLFSYNSSFSASVHATFPVDSHGYHIADDK